MSINQGNGLILSSVYGVFHFLTIEDIDDQKKMSFPAFSPLSVQTVTLSMS